MQYTKDKFLLKQIYFFDISGGDFLSHIWATPSPRAGYGTPPASIRPERLMN